METICSNMTINLQEFLLAIRQAGGRTTTTELKAALGYSSSQIHYRYEVAEDEGMIDTYQPTPVGGKPRAKVVELTENGDEWLRERTSEETLDEESITVSRVEIERLHNRIDELERRINAQNELIQRMRYVVNATIPYVRQLRDMIQGEYFNDWDGETIEDWEYDFEY